jgi:RNA polymerase sigma-70 factor, ECF subfamily
MVQKFDTHQATEMLVERAQNGDDDAVSTLYERYERYVQLIYRYIYFRIPTPMDAEDLTAEVFTRVIRSLPSYEFRDVPFEVWLYRIAAARIADFYRSNRIPVDELLSDTALSPELHLEEQLQNTEDVASLIGAFSCLPEKYQTILILRFVERKSHEEVAAIMENTVSSVKSLQHRALIMLSKKLGMSKKARHYLR